MKKSTPWALALARTHSVTSRFIADVDRPLGRRARRRRRVSGSQRTALVAQFASRTEPVHAIDTAPLATFSISTALSWADSPFATECMADSRILVMACRVSRSFRALRTARIAGATAFGATPATLAAPFSTRASVPVIGQHYHRSDRSD